MHKLLL